MNRIIVLALATLVTTCAFAQGTFTIRRPLDGASVRETVSVRIPKNSIPDGGYIGVYVNGQFLEAALPQIEGEDYVYKLNTQARKLADGPAKIEVALFVDVNGKPQITNKSSVNVVIDNHTSIKVPEGGIKLRYKFVPGSEKVYSYTSTQEVGMISQAQAQLGSHAPTISTDDMKVRILYATDNVYNGKNGKEGLLRMQVLPDKGKDYAEIIPPGESKTEKISADQMIPLFMRITDVGREVFSSQPAYFGVDGKSGATTMVPYYPILPLPVLPTMPVKPGVPWQATQLFGNVNPDKAYEMDKFTIAVPARGELEEVTWFKGRPCAVVHTVIAVGPELLKDVKNLNQIKGNASNVKLEGRIWFAMDRGEVVRMEVEVVQESLVDSGAAGGSGGAAGGGGGGANPAGAKKGGPSGVGGGGGAPGLGDVIHPPVGGFEFRPQYDGDGNLTFFQAQRGGGRKGGPGGVGGGNMGGQTGPGGGTPGAGIAGAGGGGAGGRFGQRGGGGATGSRKMVMRVRLSYVAELEQ